MSGLRSHGAVDLRVVMLFVCCVYVSAARVQNNCFFDIFHPETIIPNMNVAELVCEICFRVHMHSHGHYYAHPLNIHVHGRRCMERLMEYRLHQVIFVKNAFTLDTALRWLFLCVCGLANNVLDCVIHACA